MTPSDLATPDGGPKFGRTQRSSEAGIPHPTTIPQNSALSGLCPIALRLRNRDTHEPAECGVTRRKLRVLGFVSAGEIQTGGEGGRLRQDRRELPRSGGLYAFVVNDPMIGGCLHRCRRRPAAPHRRRPLPGAPCAQAAPCRGAASPGAPGGRAGERVRVMVAAPRSRSWKGIPVTTALGAEPALVARALPALERAGN